MIEREEAGRMGSREREKRKKLTKKRVISHNFWVLWMKWMNWWSLNFGSASPVHRQNAKSRAENENLFFFLMGKSSFISESKGKKIHSTGCLLPFLHLFLPLLSFAVELHLARTQFSHTHISETNFHSARDSKEDFTVAARCGQPFFFSSLLLLLADAKRGNEFFLFNRLFSSRKKLFFDNSTMNVKVQNVCAQARASFISLSLTLCVSFSLKSSSSTTADLWNGMMKRERNWWNEEVVWGASNTIGLNSLATVIYVYGENRWPRCYSTRQLCQRAAKQQHHTFLQVQVRPMLLLLASLDFTDRIARSLWDLKSDLNSSKCRVSRLAWIFEIKKNAHTVREAELKFNSTS